jgi:hypothetical protein
MNYEEAKIKFHATERGMISVTGNVSIEAWIVLPVHWNISGIAQSP